MCFLNDKLTSVLLLEKRDSFFFPQIRIHLLSNIYIYICSPSYHNAISKGIEIYECFVRRMAGVEIISLRYFIFVTHLIMKLALYCLGM